MKDSSPHYNIYFEQNDLENALICLKTYGYCVIRKVLDSQMVQRLKDSIDENLDPDRSLPQKSNRYHMAFAEVSKPLWKLMNHSPYMDYVHEIHKTHELCLHRSAAILRTRGEPMGMWHTDHRSFIQKPLVPNDVLNRFA
ncbi:MAG: hypothetical protein JKY51_11540, partial [Opitutaceae bacterium]|nr:hypothetical protein [Opitutaceae bacterium]